MKKAIYVLSAALMVFASSCSKENVSVEPEGVKMVKATIKASSTDSGMKTTATKVDTVYKINWEEGDELSVFNDLNTAMSKFTATEAGPSTEFNGEIPEFSKVTYAILPYDAKAKVSGTTVYTSIPAEQNGDFSNIVLAGWPKTKTRGESTYDFNYQFEAVSGIVKFHFDPEKIKTPEGDPLLAEGEKVVAVSLIADRPIVGDAQISYAGEKPVMTAGTKNVSNVINFIIPAGLTKDDYYFATLPVLPTDEAPTMGITVAFETNKGNTAHVNAALPGSGKKNIFSPNIVKNIGTVKFSAFDPHPFTEAEFTAASWWENGKWNHKKITFSRGNLQYRASDKTWRFALNQWDVQGNRGNSTMPEVNEFGYYKSEGPRATQAEWIDLFGFGQSGWNDGSRTYYPSECTADDSHFFYNYYTNDLAYKKEGDWGYLNKILNDGVEDPAGTWRVPTADELEWILFHRGERGEDINTITDSHGDQVRLRYLRCAIEDLGGNKHFGLLIFPDGFTWPAGVEVPLLPQWPYTPINQPGIENELAPVYPLSLFANKFSNCGFLPSAGCRNTGFDPNDPTKMEVPDVNIGGRYWTTKDRYLAVYVKNISMEAGSLWWARSVRLIKDVPADE